MRYQIAALVLISACQVQPPTSPEVKPDATLASQPYVETKNTEYCAAGIFNGHYVWPHYVVRESGWPNFIEFNGCSLTVRMDSGCQVTATVITDQNISGNLLMSLTSVSSECADDEITDNGSCSYVLLNDELTLSCDNGILAYLERQ